MVNAKFNNVKIKGISTVIPIKEFDIRDDERLYNGDKRKIQRVINSSGFLKRRVTEENVTTSDLCLQAAEDLIKNMRIEKESIDALLFISYTSDYLMPATSYVLHKSLNLKEDCIVMDIPQACSGFVIGLYQASMLLNSGCKRVLLLVGDTFSKFNDMFINHTAPVFGDAGSATLIDLDEKAEPTYFNIHSNGKFYDSLICKNGGFRNTPTKEMFYENNKFAYEANMNGGEIFDFTMEKIAPSIKSLLEKYNIKISDIDEFIFHQANKFILENIAIKLGIDVSKISTETLTNYGNQCGASIPCCISNIFAQKVSNNNVKCLLSGFGVGLSWANVIINLDNIYCSLLNEYDK